MKENILVVFDKDGTLTRTKSGATFAKSPEDQEPLFDFNLPSWYSVLGKEPRNMPNSSHPAYPDGAWFTYAIATNQKGISMRHKSEDFFAEEIAYLKWELNFPADAILACPDEGDNLLTMQIQPAFAPRNNLVFDCFSEKHTDHFGIPKKLRGTFRKPQPGMLLAMEYFLSWQSNTPISFDQRIFIGDRDTDRLAAEQAGFNYWDIQEWLKAQSEGYRRV